MCGVKDLLHCWESSNAFLDGSIRFSLEKDELENVWASGIKCTDLRDLVFGLLGITKSACDHQGQRLIADYGMSAEDVFRDFIISPQIAKPHALRDTERCIRACSPAPKYALSEDPRGRSVAMVALGVEADHPTVQGAIRDCISYAEEDLRVMEEDQDASYSLRMALQQLCETPVR